MANTHNTMRHAGWMTPDALRVLVAVVGLYAVADATRAEAAYTGRGSAVAELQTAGVVDALVSDEPQALPGIAPLDLSFRDMISHSNNTRFVLDESGVVLETPGSLWNAVIDRKGLLEDAPLLVAPSSVGAVPAPGALWLLALGTLRTRRRRRD